MPSIIINNTMCQDVTSPYHNSYLLIKQVVLEDVTLLYKASLENMTRIYSEILY